MIPRIKRIMPISDYRLQVKFDDDKEVVYDVKEDIEQMFLFWNRKFSAHLNGY